MGENVIKTSPFWLLFVRGMAAIAMTILAYLAVNQASLAKSIDRVEVRMEDARLLRAEYNEHCQRLAHPGQVQWNKGVEEKLASIERKLDKLIERR